MKKLCRVGQRCLPYRFKHFVKNSYFAEIQGQRLRFRFLRAQLRMTFVIGSSIPFSLTLTCELFIPIAASHALA